MTPHASLGQTVADNRRRAVLCVLSQRGSASLGELTEEVQVTCDAPSADRLRLELYHIHLPKLDDAGLVAFDPAKKRAHLHPATPAAEQFVASLAAKD